jgi:enoyl-CoA hydratase
MEFTTIRTALEQNIFTITINRPQKLNALNSIVFNELEEAMNMVYEVEDIKAVIITGAGEKAFVAGADISEFVNLKDEDAALLAKRGQDVFFQIENCPKPVIAAVNGFALGGGCELAMACHFRIASVNAKFGQPEVNLGLIPGYGGTQRLTMLVGKGKAMEMMMTGDFINSEEAKNLSLVNYVESAENLIPKTKEIIRSILSKSPVALSKVISAVNSFFEPNKDGFNEEVHLFAQAFRSDDKKEGIAAFLEKRKPAFKGK